MKLKKAFSQLDLTKKDKDNLTPGILGFLINGTQTVEVPGRNGYVYVRLRDNLNEVVQAYNDAVSPAYNLAVLLYRDDVDKTRYRVHSRDTGRYQDWGSYSAYLPRHGNQHSFTQNGTGGGDVVWVYGNQLMPLLGMPSGSYGSMGVLIGEYNHYYNGSWQAAGNTGTSDLSAYKPTGSNARMVLVYMDANGNPKVRASDEYFSVSVTGSSSVITFLPSLEANEFPVCGVRLVSGTTSIGWSNLYDVRDHYGGWLKESTITGNEHFIVVTGSASLANERVLTAGSDIVISDGGAGSTITVGVATGTFSRASHSHTFTSTPTYPSIWDDSTYKGTGTALSFGNNMNVVFSGTTAFISSVDTVGGGGSDLLIYEDNVFKVTGTAINFGDNLDVVVTGSMAFVTAVGVTGSSGSQGLPGDNTLLIYDNGVFKTTGTSISFDSNLSVTTTGSVAFISSTGGSGGGVSVYTSTYANKPTSDLSDGDLFFPSDGFVMEMNTGTQWKPWGPLYPFTQPPALGTWEWSYQGSGTATATITDTYGGLVLYIPPVSGDQVKILSRPLPSAPYTITFATLCMPHAVNYNQVGVGLRNSSDGKLTFFYVGRSTMIIGIDNFTDQFTYSTSPKSISIGNTFGLLMWFRIVDDGANRIFYYSVNGRTFHQAYSVGNTDFLTPDQICLMGNTDSSTLGSEITLLSYKEE